MTFWIFHFRCLSDEFPMDRLILGLLSMGKITIKNIEYWHDLEYQKFNKKQYLIISQKMWPLFWMDNWWRIGAVRGKAILRRNLLFCKKQIMWNLFLAT